MAGPPRTHETASMPKAAQTVDPLSALKLNQARQAAFCQRETRLLADLAEMERTRKVFDERFDCEQLCGLLPEEQVNQVPQHFADLASDLHTAGMIDGCGWRTEAPTGSQSEILYRTFTLCFLARDAMKLREVVEAVTVHHREMKPAAAVGEFLNDWREREADAWYIRGPVSRNAEAVRVLEFAAELQSSDLFLLNTKRRVRIIRVIIQALNDTGRLFSGGRNRELHGWWGRVLALVRTVAGKDHGDVSEAAARWLQGTGWPKIASDRSDDANGGRHGDQIEPVQEIPRRRKGDKRACAIALKRQERYWESSRLEIARLAKCDVSLLAHADYRDVEKEVERKAKLKRAKKGVR